METIQKICGINGYNYNSNHSPTYNSINKSIEGGITIILQKSGTVNTHLYKPYNITVKHGDVTLREFHPMRKMLDSKKLGKILQKAISKITNNNN